MGIRMVWLYGEAYSTTGDVNVKVVTAEGGVEYNGPVTTNDEEMPMEVKQFRPLITWEIDDETPIDDDAHGVLTITPTNGDMTVVTSGSTKFYPDNFVKVARFEHKGVKFDATIDGEPYNPGPGYDPSNFDGAWNFIIRDGQTMVLNMHLSRLPYSLPGYVYPLDANHPDYYDGDGSPSSGQRNRPHWDPLKAGKMIPSYEPEYSEDNSVVVPINIPAPIDIPVSQAVGHKGDPRSIFNNDGPLLFKRIIVKIDIDNDNEPDIIYTRNYSNISVLIDDDVNVNLTIKEQEDISFFYLDVDNDAEPDIIITKNANGTYDVNVDPDLDVTVDVDIT